MSSRGEADSSVEVWNEAGPVAAGNPLVVSPVAGGAGGLTDAELRATPVKVDDDATQAVLASLLAAVDGLEALLAGGLPAALTTEGALKVALQASAAGGLSPYRNIDLGVNGQVVKNTAGMLYTIRAYNRAATERFLKIYDKATAATSGDTPVYVEVIPAASGLVIPNPNGILFTNGIGVRGTTGVADNDNTAPSANDIVIGLAYK